MARRLVGVTMARNEADIIEANAYYDHKVTGAAAGLFGSTVIA